MRRFSFSSLALVYLLLTGSLAFAQVTGSIDGVVKDSSGSAVPGASISMVSDETDAQLQTTSDQSGAYTFPLIRAGRYRMTVEAAGFQRMIRPDVTVNTAQQIRLDVSLQVGAVNETVTVSAETPLLQSERATVGQVIEQRTIQSIPLATRNFTQILGTSAGVVGSIFNADNPGTGSDSMSVNGARRGSNNLLVDGLPTVNQLNNAPDGDGTPSIEFLGELKVLTSLYSSEYGRNSGSVINVTTRSGSNSFHGATYEYLRNTDLNARRFFDPKRGQNIQNQFGANIGGPVFRDKTFFFFGWESSRQSNANSSNASLNTIVPTANQRQGVFSKTIIDPSTGAPFPNNTIPTARLNPISLQIQAAFFPLPNFSSGANNFFAAAPVTTVLDQFTSRIDHRFNDKNTLFGRWFRSHEVDTVPFGQGLPGFGNSANRTKNGFGGTDTHVFNGSLILESKFGYDMTDQFFGFANSTDPATVGLKVIPGVTKVAGMPRINISNYLSNGFGNMNDWHDNIHTFTSGATLTYLRGNHSMKFGGEWRLAYMTPQNTQSARGVFSFNGVATGDEYADFLLDIPRTKLFGAGPGQMAMKAHYAGGFATDSWKVTQALTVEMGIRYEAAFQPAAYNLKMVNFWPQNYKGVGTLEGSGLVQGGVNGVPSSTVFGDWNNFMPRLGVAWRATDKWVIRAGAGLYFDERTGQITQGLFANPPTFLANTLDCAIPGQACNLKQPDNWTFVDPGYDPAKIAFPTKATDQLQYSAVNPNTLNDNAWQWNFTVQRQLPKNILVETAYIGTKGTHLNMKTTQINPLIPQSDGTLVRRFPGFGNIAGSEQWGNSTYHSFQLTVKRRWALSTVQAVYTKAKAITSGDESSRFNTGPFPAPWNDYTRARGPANFDRPQRMVVNFTQDLPNKFTSGFAKAVLNNWSMNGYFIIQSGIPLSVVNRDSGAGLGGTETDVTGNFLSNVISGVPLIHPSGSTKENLQSYINKAAWSKAPIGTYGNAGRGMFRGPGQWNTDFSVFKDFKIRERINLQFRSEFFNILNHANFALGSDTNGKLSLDSASFGQITSTSVNARLIQFALRLGF
ncbi:MAG: TonB-dependent receptor [Bryobacteraceae bacterium]